MKAPKPNHWTVREFPECGYFGYFDYIYPLSQKTEERKNLKINIELLLVSLFFTTLWVTSYETITTEQISKYIADTGN